MHQQPVCSETTFCSGYSQTDVFFRQRQTSVSSGHLHVHPFTFNWWTAPQPESLSPASPHHWAHPHEKITAAALCYAIPMKERMEKRWNGGGGLSISPLLQSGGEIIYYPPKEKERKLIKESWRRVWTGSRRVMEGGAGGAERVSEQISCAPFWHQWTAAFLIHSALNNLTVSHAIQTRAGYMADIFFDQLKISISINFYCHLTSLFIYNMIQVIFSILTL